MKAMLLGFAASIVIAVVEGVAQANMNPGSDQAYSVAESVRLY